MNLDALLACVSSPACLVTQTMAGLIAGTLLFLVASGLTLIFGVLGFVNFMHGSFYMLGGYFGYTAYRLTNSFALAVLAAAGLTALTGYILERTVVKRLYAANPLAQILVCYAFIIIFDDVVRLIWGADFLSMGMPEAFRVRPYFLAGGVVPPFYVLLIGVTVGVALALILVLNATRLGSTIRAAAQNRAMVSALGINTGALFTVVFMLGAALAGAAGALAAPVRSVSAGMGFAILIDSFIVTVIGGMGSVPGAFLVAVGLGLLRAYGSVGFPLFNDGLVFLVMAIVLVLRPHGLLGRPMRSV